MKSEKNILIAFLLNILFSVIELCGGILTNSISIMSDAIHDFGDALSIGLSLILEKKSKKQPDNNYSYGYARYSILGAFITTSILTIGSILVILTALNRLFNPITINHNGMIIFAIFGVIINFLAAYFTKDGHSLNQKAVNLHMLEDVFGWVIVLIGSILIKFTNITIIDSIMSLLVSLYILIHAIKNFSSIIDLFLEKTPKSISLEALKNNILKIPNITDVHHIHIWSIDGYHNYATMHIVTDTTNSHKLKHTIRENCQKLGINHLTIELENNQEHCDELECHVDTTDMCHHHHHH